MSGFTINSTCFLDYRCSKRRAIRLLVTGITSDSKRFEHKYIYILMFINFGYDQPHHLPCVVKDRIYSEMLSHAKRGKNDDKIMMMSEQYEYYI